MTLTKKNFNIQYSERISDTLDEEIKYRQLASVIEKSTYQPSTQSIKIKLKNGKTFEFTDVVDNIYLYKEYYIYNDDIKFTPIELIRNKIVQEDRLIHFILTY